MRQTIASKRGLALRPSGLGLLLQILSSKGGNRSCFGATEQPARSGCRSDGPSIAVEKVGDDAQHDDHDMINN